MSPSPAKNGSASMPWIWTGTPSGHGPNAHSPVTGTQDSQSTAPGRARTRLREPLGLHDPEREAEVDEVRGQRCRRRVGQRVDVGCVVRRA